MKRYENLEKAMCKELDKLDKKYANDVPEMTVQDVEKADVLFHAMKSAETYYAMKDVEDWDDDEMEGSGRRGNDGRMYSGRDRSYRRGRDSMGRYTSREMGGYYGGESGHYPDWMPPMYPRY